jgi:hypothetical protein
MYFKVIIYEYKEEKGNEKQQEALNIVDHPLKPSGYYV